MTQERQADERRSTNHESRSTSDPWLVWQLVDSAFPTGAFAHSAGLEAAWQGGEVPDEAALRRFLAASIMQAGHAGLPLVTAAHTHPARLTELDALCDAFLTNSVANRASRVQGRAFIATCARTWPSPDLGTVLELLPALCGHYAPLFGVSTTLLDLPLASAQRLFLFTTARTVLAAAVRLGVVGSYQAQRLLHDCVSDLDLVLERCGRLGDRDLAQTAPVVDLLQSTHDRLYSRLFQS
jgi:urease accessory protein